MNLSNLADGIILLVSGGLIILYGIGMIFPNVVKKDTIEKSKMKWVVIIGFVITIFGLVQLVRNYL